jgi:hypothetical protein
VLLSVARSFNVILLSRVLDGLLGGDVALAQAYMSGTERLIGCAYARIDISKPGERTKVMGLIGNFSDASSAALLIAISQVLRTGSRSSLDRR